MASQFEITKRSRRPNYSMLKTPAAGSLAAGAIQFPRGLAFQESLTADNAEPANGRRSILGFITRPVKVGGPDLGDTIYPGKIELPTASGDEASFEYAEEVEAEGPDFLALSGKELSAVAVHSAGGGTGYAVGDILTIAGGTLATGANAATVRVTTVSSGAITGLEIVDPGQYTADPTTSANSATGGTGTGASLDLTMTTNAIASTTPVDTLLSFSEGKFCIAATGQVAEFEVAAILPASFDTTNNTIRLKARRHGGETK